MQGTLLLLYPRVLVELLQTKSISVYQPGSRRIGYSQCVCVCSSISSGANLLCTPSGACCDEYHQPGSDGFFCLATSVLRYLRCTETSIGHESSQQGSAVSLPSQILTRRMACSRTSNLLRFKAVSVEFTPTHHLDLQGPCSDNLRIYGVEYLLVHCPDAV